MARRNLWTQDETKTMLKIMINKNIMPLFEIKSLDKMEIYKQIKDELFKNGFRRKNEQQIETRWKTLKRSYAATEKTNSLIKQEEPKEVCPYYDELDLLLNQSTFAIESIREDIISTSNNKRPLLFTQDISFDGIDDTMEIKRPKMLPKEIICGEGPAKSTYNLILFILYNI